MDSQHDRNSAAANVVVRVHPVTPDHDDGEARSRLSSFLSKWRQFLTRSRPAAVQALAIEIDLGARYGVDQAESKDAEGIDHYVQVEQLRIEVRLRRHLLGADTRLKNAEAAKAEWETRKARVEALRAELNFAQICEKCGVVPIAEGHDIRFVKVPSAFPWRDFSDYLEREAGKLETCDGPECGPDEPERSFGAISPVVPIASSAMYSLIISGSLAAWTGMPFLLANERFLEFTDTEVRKALGDWTDAAVSSLVRLPCVFAYEASCEKDPLFGVVRRAVQRDREVRIEYEIVAVTPFLTHRQFRELAAELGVSDFEFHRTHWAVKEVDLGRALARVGVALPPAELWRHPVNIGTHQFDVGLSFPGEVRPYVKEVAEHLESLLSPDRCFYDNNYKAQLAQPDLDLLLQGIYRNRSRLVVVFLSEAYEDKPWCAGVEFRAIRDIIKSRDQQRIMFVRMDDGVLEGTFSLDGAVDARHHSPQEVARMIKQRVDLLP